MPRASRARKLVKYICEGDLGKFKSYLKKHRIDAAEFQCDLENSLLHVACEEGQEVIVRYLLKHGAPPSAANARGELPLHKALQLALTGKPHVYTDIVQPVLYKWAGALDVADDHQVTPRMLLKQLERLTSNREEEEEPQAPAADSDDEWNRKLAEEANAEYGDEYGKYEQDTHEDVQPTDWGSWADGIREAYRKKQRHSQHPPTSHSRKRRKQDNNDEEKQCKRDKLHKKLEAEHQEYLARAKRAKQRKILDAKKLYEDNCADLFSRDTKDREFAYSDIPWPFMEQKKESNRSYGCSSAASSKEDEAYGCTEAGIKAFLLCDLESAEDCRKYLKEQQIRWHPDKFLQKCGQKLCDKDRDEIMDRVNLVSQIINKLVTDAK